MVERRTPKIAIVDYEVGNLFSVAQACRQVGLDAEITDDPKAVAAAQAIILPGVGGFPQAMAALTRQGLLSPIKDAAGAGRPILGICLGQQLLMDSSTEFGHTAGLGLIEGDVVRLPDIAVSSGRRLKIPNIGWAGIRPGTSAQDWLDTPLATTVPGADFYFVHSFFVRPRHAHNRLAVADFGSFEFCAAVRQQWVFGCQFHPERSGSAGLQLYRTFRKIVETVSA